MSVVPGGNTFGCQGIASIGPLFCQNFALWRIKKVAFDNLGVKIKR